MIIDCILDRKDNEAYDGIDIYSPHDFYFSILPYGSVGDEITRAMDEGTEADVQQALCNYIIRNEYNPDICKYIRNRSWLTSAR